MSKKSGLILVFFVLQTVYGWSQGKWELRKNENGIAVYSRKAVNGNLKEVRVLCKFDATQAQLFAVLLDIERYPDWVYGNKKTGVIKKKTPENIIYFTETHLFWPIKDRDLIVELTVIRNPENKELIVEAKSIPNYMPIKASFIRVPYSLAQWKITPTDENKINVDYTFSIDPGGSMPSWLVNAAIAIGPYNSFAKLREVLKQLQK